MEGFLLLLEPNERIGSAGIYTNLYHGKDKAGGGQEYRRKGAKKGAGEESGAKAHAYRPFQRAYRQICHFQRTTEVLTSGAAWVRYIKSAMDELPDRTYKTPTQVKKAVASIIHE